MYAVIKTGGKQYKVAKGDQLKVEKLDLPVDDSIDLEVLLFADGDDVKIGSPIVDGVIAKAKVLEHGKGPKIVVFKFKAKKGYRRKQGHRQPYTLIEIESIG